MSMPKNDPIKITDMIAKIDCGDYRIPRFQRNFIWDIKKSAALLDSILKCYPIGALIMWLTKATLTEIKDIGGIKIPEIDTGKYTSYVIDGQQRITSLYLACKGLVTSDGVDFSKICISLNASKDEQIVFDAMPKDADPEDFVLLKDLYCASALNGTHQNKRIEYYTTLVQYELSVITIDDTTMKLDEVVEIFERLNLGGKALNLFSIIDARTYKPETDVDEGFDLNEKFESFNRKLRKKNYGEINSSTLLWAISACLIEKCSKRDILNNLKSSQVRSEFSKIEVALERAISHLQGNKYGVSVSSLLPYEKLLIPFTYFYYINGIKAISATKEGYLCDFFWRCVIGKRYNSSSDTNLNADILKIKDIINGVAPFQEPITLSPYSIFDNGAFSLSSAFSLGMLCLMAQRSPQSFSVGQVINITNDAISSKSEKQYHHFFPLKSKVIKGNTEYNAIADNVVNIIFMDALTNNQIKNNNPSAYIPQFSGNPNLDNALDSHYISKNGFGISDDNFDQFINARSNAMYKKLTEYLIKTASDSITGSLPRTVVSYEKDSDSRMGETINEYSTKNSNKGNEYTPNNEHSVTTDNPVKIGEMIKNKMKKLSASGYTFSEEEINCMTTPEWSKKTFHTEKPFMRKYTMGVTTTKDKGGYSRFWVEPFTFGGVSVLISKEWYERQRKLFETWYNSLQYDKKIK